MNDLVEFLNARLDEDEHIAEMARGYVPGPGRPADGKARPRIMAVQMREIFLHKFTPERMLAEVKSKRQLIADFKLYESARYPDSEGGIAIGLETALQFAALPYADHKDYREEWRV